jgi:hypothetical protein
MSPRLNQCLFILVSQQGSYDIPKSSPFRQIRTVFQAFPFGILMGTQPSSGVASHIALGKQVLDSNEPPEGKLIDLENLLLFKNNVRSDAGGWPCPHQDA